MVNLVPASTDKSKMQGLLEKAWNAQLLREFKKSKRNDQSTKIPVFRCRPMKKQTAPTVKEKPNLHSPTLLPRRPHKPEFKSTVLPERRPVPPSLTRKKSPPSPSLPVEKDCPPRSSGTPTVYNPRPRRQPLVGKESPPRSPGTPVNPRPSPSNPRPRPCERPPLVGKDSPPRSSEMPVCNFFVGKVSRPRSPATHVYDLRPRQQHCNCEKCSRMFNV